MFRFAVVFGLGMFAGMQYAAAQNQLASPTTPFLKLCNKKNPPPCIRKPPVAVYTPEPEYSDKAREAGVTGRVVLETVIGSDGLAHDIKVARSLGYGCDERAMNALTTWKFKAAQSDDGKPVPAKILIEMNFR